MERGWEQFFKASPQLLEECSRADSIAMRNIRSHLGGDNWKKLLEQTRIPIDELHTIKFADDSGSFSFITLEKIRRALGIEPKDFYGDI